MKQILILLALLASPSLFAQEITSPSTVAIGRELARSRMIPSPTAEGAREQSVEQSPYMAPLVRWESGSVSMGSNFVANFAVPFAWLNRTTLFHIDGAPYPYQIVVNGRVAGYSQNPFVPFDFDISQYVVEGRNSVEVVLHRGSIANKLVDPKAELLPMGECYVYSQPKLRVRDIVAHTTVTSPDMASVEIGVVMKTSTLNPRLTKIYYELRDTANRVVAEGNKEIVLDMRREDTVKFFAQLPKPILWSAATPNQYTLVVRNFAAGRNEEFVAKNIGARSVEVKGGDLYINGVKEKLRSRVVNSNPTYGELMQLKTEGYNVVMLEAGRISDKLLTQCDQVGLYVVAQTPINTMHQGSSRKKGGNISNDPQWRDAYIDRAQTMRDAVKLHPSVVGFSIADNSSNGICLYDSYLNLKSKERWLPVVYRYGGDEWNADKMKW